MTPHRDRWEGEGGRKCEGDGHVSVASYPRPRVERGRGPSDTGPGKIPVYAHAVSIIGNG